MSLLELLNMGKVTNKCEVEKKKKKENWQYAD